MSFTTSTLVKRRLQIPPGITTHDLLIDDIVAEINVAVADASGQAGLAGVTVTEQLTIKDRGITERGFDNFPWASVVALTLDGGLQVLNDDYVVSLDIGYIHLKNGRELPIGENLTQITYVTSDQTGTGSALQRAATNWAVAEVNKAPHHGMVTEKFGRYAYRLDENDMPASVRTAIGRYCKAFEL